MQAAVFFRLPKRALEKVAVFAKGLVQIGLGHNLRVEISVKTRGEIIAEAV